MAYEAALRLLASLETPKPPDMPELKYQTLLDDCVRWVVGGCVSGRQVAWRC